MLFTSRVSGIDRPDDERFVREYFGKEKWLELRIVDATDEFLKVLAWEQVGWIRWILRRLIGKKPPISMDAKRRAMKGVYKMILEREIADFGASFIAQGTLYTDISESGSGYDSGARKATIKKHHNVGIKFTVPELTPLDDCVKDTGRNIGRSLGVPEELLVRHPFPGPGLVVRIEGMVTRQTLAMARKADDLYIEELRRWMLSSGNVYDSVWQAGAVISGAVTTSTKGDDSASGTVVILWAVWSVNGFTARWAELPADFLRGVSTRITNEIREVGAVAYRISDKPPSTIEMG